MHEMPWGKYRGYALYEIPISYLAWILERSGADSALQEAVASELLRRLAPRSAPQRDVLIALIGGVVDQWFRKAAMRHHPDRGGNGEAMAAINQVYTELRDLLKQLQATR
jgi:hypothetical protein